MPVDLTVPLFFRPTADIVIACLLVGVGWVFARKGAVEEESHAQKEPRSEEPHDGEDDE